MVIMFISRSLFIKILGVSIAGANSLFISLIGFLNVAELGVGTAVGYSLYKPLKNNDFNKINNIMIMFKHYYRNIAKIVLVLGIFLSIFLRFLIKDQIDLNLAYLYYYIYLFNCILSYIFSYKQTLIIADQKQYKIATTINVTKIIRIIIQCIILYIVPSFLAWLIIEVIFNLLGMLLSNKIIDLEYTNIDYKSTKYLQDIKDENTEIKQNIKNVFFHKIGAFVVFQTDAIVITLFSTLKETAIYSNYMMVINSLTNLLSSAIGSIMPSIGNLIAEGDNNKTYNIFRQLYLMDHIIALSISIVTFKVIDEFVVFWVGSEFLFSRRVVIALIINLYIQLSRGTKDRFKDGYGIYWDTKSPIVESTVNIIFSVYLSYKIGIIGVFIGTIISNILIIELWKPYILFKDGFKKSIFDYIKQTSSIYIRNIMIFVLSNYIFNYIECKLVINNEFFNIIMHVTLISFIVLILIFIFYRNEDEFKIIKNIIINKIKTNSIWKKNYITFE